MEDLPKEVNFGMMDDDDRGKAMWQRLQTAS